MVTTITRNGDHTIREKKYTVGGLSTITIESNPDGATASIGYRGNDGNFKAYPDGLIIETNGLVFVHGSISGGSIELMAYVTGLSSGSMIINVEP